MSNIQVKTVTTQDDLDTLLDLAKDLDESRVLTAKGYDNALLALCDGTPIAALLLENNGDGTRITLQGNTLTTALLPELLNALEAARPMVKTWEMAVPYEQKAVMDCLVNDCGYQVKEYVTLDANNLFLLYKEIQAPEEEAAAQETIPEPGTYRVMKHHPKKISLLTYLVLFAGLIPALIGGLISSTPLVAAGLIIAVGAIIARVFLFRCPNCGAYLEKASDTVCPRCKKPII